MRSVKRAWRIALCGMACLVSGPGIAQGDFPFDRELVMDAAPLRGSKRIPNLEISPNGAVVIEMWCNKVDAQMVVAADTLTILTGQQTNRPCAPNQTQGDADLLQDAPACCQVPPRCEGNRSPSTSDGAPISRRC